MSDLIDYLVDVHGQCKGIYEGAQYILKPYYFDKPIDRVKDAWRVLVGKSRAYHFREDEDDCSYVPRCNKNEEKN